MMLIAPTGIHHPKVFGFNKNKCPKLEDTCARGFDFQAWSS